MNKKISTEIAVGIILIVAIIFGGLILLGNKQQNQAINMLPKISNNTGQKGCTQEVKVCPDGTSVGRTGPNCEFSECPVAANDHSFVQDDDICKNYSKALKKYGNIKYGIGDINLYDENSTGTLCTVTAEKYTYSPNFEKAEKEILKLLENDNWQDTENGGDKPGIGDFGSNTVYERDKDILIFERGVERDGEKRRKCMDDNQETESLVLCIDKIEARIFFTIMAGKATK